MPSSNSVPNPYDFRSPVRNRQLLAGRAQTLEQVDSFLRQAAAGRPVHFSLFGPPGVGKSSLLNAVMATAAERRLLPIKLSLRQATCESEVAFYGAFFEAAFQKLLENGLIASDGELMASWLRQTRSGELVGPEHHPFEIALAIAADLNGKMVRHIQVPSLIRDISRILTLAENLRGIVLCVDAAEHLDASHDVADSLLELVDADPRIVLVTAAPQAGRLQAAASRSWAQIEVGPFETPQEVFEAITRPLESVDRSTFTLSPAAAEDIYTLTRGQPYEISLVCHFIWEAIQQQRQAEFELSDAVIERVLGEFIERGRHEASADIAHVAKLTTRDYELLAKLAPYEARSEELDMEQRWVTVYNTAYVNARMERFEEAARLAQSAVDALGENEREMILHADLPTPAGWQHDVPWIAIVHVPAPWLERFLTLQTAVWRARADEQQIPGLEHELGQCVESVPLPVLRLAGWAELTVTRRHEHGLKLLDLAIDAAPLHEIELARRELARLTQTADQPQVPTTPAQNTTIATTREGPAPA